MAAFKADTRKECGRPKDDYSEVPVDAHHAPIAERKVDILSSLTTTHTTRHADGTVTKKVPMLVNEQSDSDRARIPNLEFTKYK